MKRLKILEKPNSEFTPLKNLIRKTFVEKNPAFVDEKARLDRIKKLHSRLKEKLSALKAIAAQIDAQGGDGAATVDKISELSNSWIFTVDVFWEVFLKGCKIEDFEKAIEAIEAEYQIK